MSSGLGLNDIGRAAAEICIPSFDKKVKQSSLTQLGVPLRLQKKGDIYYIMIVGTEVGYLSERYSKMVSECSKMGVGYKGEIVIKNSSPYARFVRVSK